MRGFTVSISSHYLAIMGSSGITTTVSELSMTTVAIIVRLVFYRINMQ